MIEPKEIFEELENAGDFIEMGYMGKKFFFTISKMNYEEIKRRYCEIDWTGY